jgi:hypothetical protein
VNLLPKQPPPTEVRNTLFKVVMLGVALPVGILLALQTTRYSLFPGKARILWGILDVAVFGILLLNSLWVSMDRRAKQGNTR